MTLRKLSCNGWIPASEDEAPFGFATSFREGHPPECLTHVDRIFRGADQLSTESCVAWSYAQALWVLLGTLGMPRVWPSVLALYWWTRARSHDGDRSAIWDGGSRMTDAAVVLREIGWCPDKAWPFRAQCVNEEPPWHAIASGCERDWLRPRRVATERDRTIDVLCDSLSAPGRLARPVVRGVRVDQAYLDWTPGDPPWRLRGEVIGRHAEAVVGYCSGGLIKVSSWGDAFDRIESWANVRDDVEAETWIVDVDVAALYRNVQWMGF